MCVCVCVCTYICIYIYKHTHTYIHIYLPGIQKESILSMARDMRLFRHRSCAEDARGVDLQLSGSTGVSIGTFVLVNLVN